MRSINSDTQALIAILKDKRMSSIGKNAKAPDPLLSEVCSRIDEFPSDSNEVEEGRQYAKNLVGIIGGSGMAQVVEYWTLRDAVRKYQAEHQISGIETVSSVIAGHTIEYRSWHDQLLLLDSDIPMIRADVTMVADSFCDLTQKLDYKLYREVDEKYFPATTEEVKVFANLPDLACQAWLYAESLEWIPHGDGWRGHSADRFLPDKITLSISLGRPDVDSDSVYFVAEHPDPKRFPFRN